MKLSPTETICGMHATDGAGHGPSIVYEVDGEQVVSVGRYAYRWHGAPPLEVGERVRLPENWFSRKKDGPGHWVGVVTGLGSSYTGVIAAVVGRVASH